MAIQNPINSEQKSIDISFNELLSDLKNWLSYIFSNWKLILLFLFLGSALGLTYSFIQKAKYTATLTFALEDEKTSGVGLSGALGLASSLGFDLGTSAGGAFNGANLMELMRSRTLIEKSLLNPINVSGKEVSLAEYYTNFSGLREKLDNKPSLSSIHFTINDKREGYSRAKDSVLGEIYKNIVGENKNGLLTVSQEDKKVSIISVNVVSVDEYFSKSLAESLVKEVSEFYIFTKSKKAKTNVAILQRQTDSIRAELNDAISGVAQSSDNTFNLNSALNIKRVPTSHRQVDVQANTAILTQLVTNLEMAKVTLLKETPLIQIIDKPILPLKVEKVSKLKGIIIGSFIFTLIAILILLLKSLFKTKG